MTPLDASLVRALGFVAAASLFWLQYWDMKDRKRPEPRAHLVGAFVVGGVSVALAHALYAAAGALGVPVNAMTGTTRVLLVCVLVAGPVEELSKFAAARCVVFRWRHFDERVDGVVYGAAVSLGFAAVENVFWLRDLGTVDGLVRAICTPLVHTLFGAIWGYGAARALLDGPTRAARFGWQAGTLALAAVGHGVYDAILALGAPSHVVAAVVLALWIAVILIARRAALRDDAALGDAPRPR